MIEDYISRHQSNLDPGDDNDFKFYKIAIHRNTAKLKELLGDGWF